jgi:hypothetical protein
MVNLTSAAGPIEVFLRKLRHLFPINYLLAIR